ncbi:Putative alpha/beta hydrolase-1 [Septoria linicola]|uniref:Alpha/beta hydrolase-1 n=1 Tax=Septoria linicola TaxID=215465 RepID=A0A9Q9EEE0_9PEZI|nr:Putative alpha/beta hydrolase-1 [Septoria linicola]
MADQKKPAIVLVHGAWHTPAHWYDFITRLNKAGYSVEAPQLASSNNEEVDAAFSKDVETIKQAIQTIISTGQDLVVVMHSYGGMCGSEAVASFFEDAQRNQNIGTGTIVRLIYVSAIILPRGKLLFEDGNTLLELKIEGRLAHKLEPRKRFYNTTAQEHADKAIALLRAHSLEAFTTPPEHQGWSDYGVPVTYIACKSDQALVYDPDLLKFVQRLRDAAIPDLSLFEMENTDHSPWISAEAELWKILLAELQKPHV